MSDFSQDRLVSLLAYADRVTLRHDVDYDPDCARQMARLEHSIGVTSTYYFMVCGTYNPFQPAVGAVIREVASYGHTVGVHVELNLGRECVAPDWVIERHAARQHMLLSAVYRGMVSRKISLHAPPHAALWRTVRGFDHAMSPRWEGLYAADSRGVFRTEPEHLITDALERGDRPQLNLHPEWWFWPQEKADAWRAIEAAKP